MINSKNKHKINIFLLTSFKYPLAITFIISLCILYFSQASFISLKYPLFLLLILYFFHKFLSSFINFFNTSLFLLRFLYLHSLIYKVGTTLISLTKSINLKFFSFQELKLPILNINNYV